MKPTDKEKEKKKVAEVKTFSVPFPPRENQENITVITNSPSKPSKEQIIKQAFKFHSQGNTSEAAKCYRYCINQGFTDHRVFSNYGVILKDLGNLQEAEVSYRKAIELKTNYADAHYNLGHLFNDLGNLQEAEVSYRKAIKLKPNYADAYYNLGHLFNDLGNLQEAEES